MSSTEIKIAYLGGGSRYWARDLLAELALTPRLTGRVDLYDLDHAAAEKNVAIAAGIFARPEARTRFAVRAVPDLTEALRGADFVILSIEPGPTTARFADLEIPARYGILQSVGDTTGPGGVARALRAVPLYAEFARAIMAHCPRAWVINYTNPMTLCTAALYAAAPGIKALGCCHEVFHTQTWLAERVARWFGVAQPARQEIALELAGINHFTWATAAHWQGHDLLARLHEEARDPATWRSHAPGAEARKAQEKWFESDALIARDLLRRFGALGAAGDRHLAEFVPWYLGSEAELHRWGVVLTPYAWRLRRAQQQDHAVSFYAQRALAPSDEEGVQIIEALLGIEPLRTNVNVPNQGQIAGLPVGHVVESYVDLGRNQITPRAAGVLPPAALALVQRVVAAQQITLEAALAHDAEAAFQAVLLDPLVALPTETAWTMWQEMLAHLRPQLAGWRGLPAA